MLSGAPTRPIDDEPAFGTYVGRCTDTELRLDARGVGRLRRTFSEKRWQWFSAFDESIAVGGAIVDAGIFGTAFLWVFDRERASLVVDADVTVPSRLVAVSTQPANGVVASVSLPRRRLRVTRTNDALSVDGRFAGTDVSLVFDTAGRHELTAICPVENRTAGVNVTQKETCIPVRGTVDSRRISRRLDGVGMLDYSHGLLARETTWKWAIGSCTAADGATVGFNVVDGFNDALENAVWIDGEPRSVDAATFSVSAGQWHVRTDCGTVDVTLDVEGRRSENIDIGVIASRYDQPLGRWSGTVSEYDIDGVGVAEEHLARW